MMMKRKNPALLLSCVSSQVRNGLKADVEQMKLKDPNFKPGLVVLQVDLLSCCQRSWRMCSFSLTMLTGRVMLCVCVGWRPR